MTLREQMASDIADVFMNTGEFAEAVTYTVSGGSPTSINAIFDESEEPSHESDGKVKIRRGTLIISVADIASPGHGDTVAVNSETWDVLGVTERDDYTATLDIRRIEAIERSARGHRIERGG